MGLSLVKRLSMLRVTFNIERAEGEPPWCAGCRATTLYSVGSGMDPHHEAVIRFSGRLRGGRDPFSTYGVKAKQLRGFCHLGS